MNILDCKTADGKTFPDLKLVELKLHGDARGFFVERYREDAFANAGLPTVYKQDNHSRSAPGVLRGMHYQFNKPQGKLVGCVRGRIWDAVVDVRPSSPTYGKSYGVELSDTNARLLWVPAGFAHGFCVLGEDVADVYYKVTEIYNPEGERGIAWNDPDFAIQWPIENPQVSARDNAQASFADYKQDPKF